MRSARPISPDGARPQARSRRVWTLLLIGSGAFLFLAAFVGTVRRDGIGGAFLTALAATVAFGIPGGIAWAWIRGHPTQGPVSFTPAPSSTLNEAAGVRPTLTLRATASARWTTLAFCLALAGGLIGFGVRGWIANGQGDGLWALTVVAAIFLAMAYASWRMCIKADDVAIVYRFVVTSRYDRREVATIRIGPFVIGFYGGSGRRVSFLRSDETVLFTTIFYWWGKDELEALASYLGVPIQVTD